MPKSGAMKRDIYRELNIWKSSVGRKPLLLQGARQTGKTYILQEFGINEYDNLIYCNFEEDPGLDQLFQRDLNPDRILAELSIYKKQDIHKQNDLIVFDEIQVSNRALNSLKYFAEQKRDLHIAAAGSLLGVKLSSPGSFPVGKVNFLHLFPMTFLEFLDAAGEERYRSLVESVKKPEPLTEALHLYLIDLLRNYYMVGGMPEAVQQYVKTGNVAATRRVQEEIINSYVLDFAKHAAPMEIPKLTQVWDSIPKHLARENKKFVFSAVKKSARAREYENALTWLQDTGLIYRAIAVQTPKFPMAHYANPASFKIYALDVGLLNAMSSTPIEFLAQGKKLFNEYEGAFVENYVAQQLASHHSSKLYYWRSRGGRAELDFLCEFSENICPLEVKAGLNPKSKSLRSYDQQFGPPMLTRTNLLNFRKDGKILNLPLYAVSLLPRLVRNPHGGEGS